MCAAAQAPLEYLWLRWLHFSASSFCKHKFFIYLFILRTSFDNFLFFSEWRRWLELSCVRRQWRTPKLTHNLTVSQQRMWNCHVPVEVLIHKCLCLKVWPTLSFTVEKLKTYSPASSMLLCRLTSPPSWIHREQACVSQKTLWIALKCC